jgi:hypothetical protein
MAGSVRERKLGIWELRVYLGRNGSGRVRHRYTTVEGTKRAAERELARFVLGVVHAGSARTHIAVGASVWRKGCRSGSTASARVRR